MIAAWVVVGCRKRHSRWSHPLQNAQKGSRNECRGGYQPPAPVGNHRDVFGRILSSPTFPAPNLTITATWRAAEGGGPYMLSLIHILVLEKGSVKERGSHSELLEKNGLYAAMWRDYQQAAAWKVGKEAAV